MSKRLESLAKFVSYNDSIIDVGCDHALLDIYLIKNDLVKKIIASDLSEDALEQGIKNIKEAGLTDKIETRLGNGLTVLTEEDDVDTVIISGMGSRTMLNILDACFLKNIKKLILQSNTDYEVLRNGITNLGYIIKEEEYFKDKDQDYVNIVFVKGEKNYTKEEILYGPILMHDKTYVEKEINDIKKVKDFVPKKRVSVLHEMNKKIKDLEKLLDEEEK